MTDLVLFAVGSALIVEVEETLRRGGHNVVAGIQNVDGACHASGDYPILRPADLTAELTQLSFVVPLFQPSNRKSAVQAGATLGFLDPASVIDPTAIVASDLTHGPGLYINAACIVGAAGSFGRNVLINRGANVGHHARLGDFVSLGPGAILTGEVNIGEGSVVGAGAIVLPRITIGKHAIVGAGAVVTRDVADGCVVFGNPARVIRRN